MLGNIVKDNQSPVGNVYSNSYTGNKTIPYYGGNILTLTGTSVPAGVYYVEGFINIVNVTNNMYAQGFIEYNGEWLDAAGSNAKAGEMFQKGPATIISHDGSTNINLHMNNSNTTTTNNLTILNPNIKAVRIA